MRGFRCPIFIKTFSTLQHSIRWNLSEQEDDLLWDNLRVILRRYGALPLPRVSALLSDEAIEIMPNIKGGLRRYMQERPSRYHVEVLSSGITVVMLAAEIRRAGSSYSLIAQVLANIAASPQQQMEISQLYKALPALTQRQCCNERHLESFLLQHSSLVTVQNGIVKAAPTSYMIRKRITPAPPPPIPGRIIKTPEKIPEAPLTHGVNIDDPKLNKLLSLLQGTVPFSFYIPLNNIIKSSRSYMCFSPGMSVDEILEELQRIPATILDCRVIGNEINDAFLRMMDAERRPYIGSEPNNTRNYDVLSFGILLINEFRTYAEKSLENKQRIQSGISMNDLKDILSPELLKKLYIYDTKNKDAACIFIFDRLRHLFDVNMTAYMVRPWELLPSNAQPSSLTWQTTPVPILLRHSLISLEEKPLTVDALTTALPTSSRVQLKNAYASVEEFISQHSLYLFLKDGLVWTPYLAAASQGARVPNNSNYNNCNSIYNNNTTSGRHLSDQMKARMIAAAMPPHHPIDWSRFRLHPNARALPFDTLHLRQDFFERYREFFVVYEVRGTTALIVGRRDGTPPPVELLQPPCNSLNDLLRLIALYAVGGAQESTIMNFLSREARLMVRRYGTIESIARQLPMWFDVRSGGDGQQGTAIISYIGSDTRTTTKSSSQEE